MRLTNKIAQYKAWKNGVKHCTFNPEGPGVVRIHLIPPKFKLFGNPPYILILNGYYLLPLGYSWAVLLSSFIDRVNKYDNREITEGDMEKIISDTVKTAHAIYRAIPSSDLKDDLFDMLDILFCVAGGEDPDMELERLSIRRYAKNMSAPHRMDLMVSAMTDSTGCWHCNQKCKFCYAAGQELSAARELSTDRWKEAIDKLRGVGVPMLTFTGGEPTLRHDIIELIDYSKWFITRLNTNGLMLNEDFCARLKAASLDSLQITFYSADESIHNSLVGGEHYKTTLTGIKNAVAAGLDVSINTPLCRKNAGYIDTLALLKDLGVRFVTLSGLIATGGAKELHEEYDLTEDELFSIVKDAKEFCDENGMEMDFTSPGLISAEKLESIGVKVPSCGAALSNMAIAPDGTVIPCQSWLGKGVSLGNILTDSFEAIWGAEMAKKLRNMTDEEALFCPFRGSEATNG